MLPSGAVSRGGGQDTKSSQLDVLLKAFIDSSVLQSGRTQRGPQPPGASTLPPSPGGHLSMNITNLSWDSIASLLPGVTADQCKRRYLELTQYSVPMPSIPNAKQRQTVADIDRAVRSHKIKLSDKTGADDVGQVAAGPAKASGDTLPAVDTSRAVTRHSLRQAGQVNKQSHATSSLVNAASSVDKPQASSSSPTPSLFPAPSKAGSVMAASGNHEGDSTWKPIASKFAFSSTPIMMSLPQEGEGPNVVIHVSDKKTNYHQDFACSQALLLKEMEYFTQYFSEQTSPEGSRTTLLDGRQAGVSSTSLTSLRSMHAKQKELRISVQCDIVLFRSLMQFANRGRASVVDRSLIKPPEIDMTSVLPHLVCSEYLQMPALIDVCTTYMRGHLDDILATTTVSATFSTTIVSRLSKLITLDELNAMKDPEDKLRSKLYMAKVKQLFDDPESLHTAYGNISCLFKCKLCSRIMTTNMSRSMVCLASRAEIDRQGRVYYRHKRCSEWSLRSYFTSMRTKKYSWMTKYWKIWGHLHLLHCARCTTKFTASEYLNSCPHCPARPAATGSTWPAVDATGKSAPQTSDEVIGQTSRCSCSRVPFNSLGRPIGCKAIQHKAKFHKDVATQSRPKTSQLPVSTAEPVGSNPASQKSLVSQSFAGMEQASKERCSSGLLRSQSLIGLDEVKRMVTSQPVERFGRSQARQNYDEIIRHLTRFTDIICEKPSTLPVWLKEVDLSQWYSSKSECQHMVTTSALFTMPTTPEAAGKLAKAGISEKKPDTGPRKVLKKTESRRKKKMARPKLSDGEEDADSKSETDSAGSSDEEEQADQNEVVKLALLASRHKNIMNMSGYTWSPDLKSRHNEDNLRENDVLRMRMMCKKSQARRHVVPDTSHQVLKGQLNFGIYGRLVAEAEATQRQKNLQQARVRRQKKSEKASNQQQDQSEME